MWAGYYTRIIQYNFPKCDYKKVTKKVPCGTFLLLYHKYFVLDGAVDADFFVVGDVYVVLKSDAVFFGIHTGFYREHRSGQQLTDIVGLKIIQVCANSVAAVTDIMTGAVHQIFCQRRQKD